MGLRKCLSALTIAGLFSLSAIPAPGADRTMPDAGVDRQARTFVVASSNNLPPINLLDGKGDLTGFAREISTAVAKAVGADTRYLHSSHYSDVLNWLETGKADLIHDTAYSEERALFLDFTDPILEMPELIFTRADQVNINGFDSLRGKSVVAVRQHISHLYLEKYPEIHLHLVGTPTEAFYLLVHGDVDAFVYPEQVVAYLGQELRIGDKIKIAGNPLRILRYSMVVKKGNKEVLDLLNEGIRKIRASGEYDRIYHRWFGDRFLAGYSKKEVGIITAAAVGLSLLVGIAVTLLVMNVTLRKTKNQLSETISELQSAEEERERLHDHLQQAMKMEAVGRLAGGVAHDFNNLLTVITGYSELLLQKVGKESPMHREVEEIRRAGERAASLTQQLLAFSRKQIIEPRVVRLDLLVAEMHKMMTRLIGENIALQATTGKSLGSVKVDPGQFHRILMNLAVNARDAMPDGGKIVIETTNVDLDEGYCAVHPYVKPGRFVMLAISDTGQGMSKEVQAHIFEPFFTTKERGSGTGLGLATTYGIVKQAGGSIEVYSEVGIGTTFKIYLPRVEEGAEKPVEDDRPTDFSGGTETVLVVEDEDRVRDLCVRILERLGYKVLRGSNGTEAIAVAQKYGDRIDLLVTDVVMPGMSGAEMAAQLVLHHPEMKVLFTSGYTDGAIVRHGVLEEGVSFIGKPYTPSALAKKVREVLGR